MSVVRLLFTDELYRLVMLFACATAIVGALAYPALTGIRVWPARALCRVAAEAAIISFACVIPPGVLGVPTALLLIFGVVGCAIAMAVLALPWEPMRAVQALRRELGDPANRAEAGAKMEKKLAASRPTAQAGKRLSAWASAVQVAAEVLAGAYELERASRVLALVQGLTFNAVAAGLNDTLHAMIAARRGDVTRARMALDAANVAATPLQNHAMHAAVSALVLALEGRSREALAALDRWAYPPAWHPGLRLEARAQAQAELDRGLAQKTLIELERNHGRAALAALAASGGPAAPLAQELLD